MAPFTMTPLRPETPGGGLIADRRLYLGADRATLLEEGNPAVAFLLAGAGSTIPKPEADRLRLVIENGRIVQHQEAPAVVPPKKGSAGK